MPATMEEWRSTSAGSKDESGGGGASTGGGGGGEVAGVATPATAGGGGSSSKAGTAAADVATPPPATIISKRQRRPSVRLGEIGDQKNSAKAEAQVSARWGSPNFGPRKSSSTNGSKLPRTRPLANVTRGEIAGQAAKAGKEGSEEGAGAVAGTQTPPVVENSAATEEEEEAEAPGAPSSTGRGNYGTSDVYAAKKSKHGKRKRASSIRSSTIAKTLGVVSLNRKAKELQKVLAVPDVLHPGGGENAGADTETDAAPVEMEEESGAARAPDTFEDEGGDHAQNGDTEVLEDDGNGEDSSGRQEGDDPESPGVRENQLASMNGAAEPAQEFVPAKDDREQCTSRLTDGDKERKNVFMIREASMNGRRGGVRGWLGSLGLDKYADLFEENEVDNDVLPLLTFEDLKEMGIVAVGARRKMFAGIQELGRLT